MGGAGPLVAPRGGIRGRRLCTKVVVTKAHDRGPGFAGLGATPKDSVFRPRRKGSGVRPSLRSPDASVVVVLDEDGATREALGTVLTVAHQVIDAPDLATTIALAVRYRPAAVVTAQDTPAIVRGRLRDLLALAMENLAPPVVLVTGRHPRHLRGAKVDGVVIKPFVPEHLLRVVSHAAKARTGAGRRGSSRAG